MRPSTSTAAGVEHADLAAVAHHDDALGQSKHLLELGGDEDDRKSLARQLGDLALDVGLRADVDAAGRLVEDDQLRGGRQPAGEQHLLLVAAGEGADEQRSGSAGRTPRARMYSVTTASYSARRSLRVPAAPRLDAERDVLARR